MAHRRAGVAVAMALVFMGFVLHRSSTTGDAPAVEPPPEVHSATPTKLSVTARKTATPAKDIGADFSAARAELERQAAAGDRDAAARLGKVLLTCDGYIEHTPEQVEAVIVNLLAQASPSTLPAMGKTLDAGSLALALQTQFEALREVCIGANGLQLDAAQRAQALAWLRQAADAGSTAAMLTYAEHAFDEYSTAREVLKSVDEVRQRKQIARAYLDRAAAAGDTDVFALRATLHETGGVLAKDAVAAYANYYAFVHSQAATPGAESRLRVFASALDEEHRRQAEQLAQQWLRHCCVETGLGP